MIKLTEENANSILASLDKGIPAPILARKYNLTLEYVQRIKILRAIPEDDTKLTIKDARRYEDQ